MSQTKKRIQVYADEETKRRIELAATKHNVPVTLYCLEAIKQQLAEDNMLEQERIEIPLKQPEEDNLIADMRALREDILTSRGGRPIDLDIVAQVREEREHELLGMR